MDKIETKKDIPEMKEKHEPVLKQDENGNWYIIVGEVEHPMEETHYITFIEAYSPDRKYTKRVFLKPGEKPILELDCTCNHLKAREYCNIHGLYEADLSKQ